MILRRLLSAGSLVLAATAVTAAGPCIPDGAERLNYLTIHNQKVEQCRPHYEALARLTRSEPWDRMKDGFVMDHAQAFTDFDSACLSKLHDLRCSTVAYLEQRLVGLFEPGEAIPFCTGFRVNESQLVTAQHCIWSDRGRLDPNVLTFAPLSNPELRGQILGESEATRASAPPTSDLHDIALLRVQPPADAALIELNYRPIEQDAQILVPGVFRPALLVEGVVGAGSWATSIRLDLQNSCRRLSGGSEQFFVAGTKAGKLCIVMQCQSFRGMSGSPVIAAYGKTLFVGGLLIREGRMAAGSAPECGDRPGLNVGIAYPNEVVQRITEEDK